MKPKILIITLDYYPKHNANTSIIQRIVSLLGKKYNIVIATQNNMNAPSYDTDQGVPIYRTPFHSLRWSINTAKNELADYVKMIIFNCSYLIKRNSINKTYVYYFVKEICNSINIQDFDLILSFSNPFSSHCCASILSQRYGIPWIAYYFDPFFSNATLCPKKTAIRKKMEEKLLANATVVMMTYPTNENYLQLGVTFKNRIVRVEMPGIVFDRVLTGGGGNRKTCKCYYIGNLYKKIRDPYSAVRVFSALEDFEIELYFVGGYYGTKIDFEKLISNNVKFLGKKNSEEIMELYKDADILLNIGNLIDNQMPSKIFEYISTGKPIINIYKINNCPTLKYLWNYPLALNIYECDLVKDTNKCINLIKDFCLNNKGKSVSGEFIKKNYMANSDIMVAKVIENYIKEMVLDKKERN